MSKDFKFNIMLILIALLFITIFALALFSSGGSEASYSIDLKPSISATETNCMQYLQTEVQKKPVQKPGQNTSDGRIDMANLPEPIRVLESDNGDGLVLVNKFYTVSPSYEPIDMVPVDNSLSTNKNLYFKKDAYDAYLKMLADANSQGIEFLICSTYRSYNTQDSIYSGYVNRNGSAYANSISAAPGRSEHHTGLAVDITSVSMRYDLTEDFINYPEGIWINNHCSEYGFIIRYPKGKTAITGYSYEPWHLRYVGVDVAKEITQRGITFEEYLGINTPRFQ